MTQLHADTVAPAARARADSEVGGCPWQAALDHLLFLTAAPSGLLVVAGPDADAAGDAAARLAWTADAADVAVLYREATDLLGDLRDPRRAAAAHHHAVAAGLLVVHSVGRPVPQDPLAAVVAARSAAGRPTAITLIATSRRAAARATLRLAPAGAPRRTRWVGRRVGRSNGGAA